MMDVALTEPQLLSRQAAREALHLGEDTFVFGTLGRLVPNKDQATLIQAFYLLKQQGAHAKLVIAGKGPLEQALKQHAQELNIAQDIIFTGFIDKAFSYLKALDCFILSSVQEAFGRVLLEAMLAKLPVIATSVNGIPEVVGDAGLLIKARDTTQLSQAMNLIYQLSPAERQTIGEKAHAHVLKHFSIPVFHTQFWHLPLLQKLKPSR
jgi:glycosyltransferase involved in cell wall biosynthesis